MLFSTLGVSKFFMYTHRTFSNNAKNLSEITTKGKFIRLCYEAKSILYNLNEEDILTYFFEASF